MVSESLGAAKEVQQHVNHGRKRMAKITQKPQNHCPRSVRASPTSAKNRTSAHCLPASWNERSRSRLKRFMQLSSFSFFWFLKKRRETAPVSNESLRFENDVGNKPTSKSVPSQVAFWRYPCNGFGDARQSSQRAWVPKALWRYVCKRFFDSSFNFGLRSEPKPLTRNP